MIGMMTWSTWDVVWGNVHTICSWWQLKRLLHASLLSGQRESWMSLHVIGMSRIAAHIIIQMLVLIGCFLLNSQWNVKHIIGAEVKKKWTVCTNTVVVELQYFFLLLSLLILTCTNVENANSHRQHMFTGHIYSCSCQKQWQCGKKKGLSRFIPFHLVFNQLQLVL